MKFKNRSLKIKSIVPNFITIVSLCLGLTSIRLSFEGHFEKALLLILAAAFMDFLDGKTARLLKVHSKLGEQLDSLADMVSFGVAPMFLVYHFALSPYKRLGWTACLFFSTCMALRLARFNAMLTTEGKDKDYFVGIPAPLGGYLIMIAFMFFLETDLPIFKNFIVNFLLVWMTGFLMISTIPVFSNKNFDFSKTNVRLLLIICVTLLPFFYTHFYLMLAVLGLTIITSIPFSFNYYTKK